MRYTFFCSCYGSIGVADSRRCTQVSRYTSRRDGEWGGEACRKPSSLSYDCPITDRAWPKRVHQLAAFRKRSLECTCHDALTSVYRRIGLDRVCPAPPTPPQMRCIAPPRHVRMKGGQNHAGGRRLGTRAQGQHSLRYTRCSCMRACIRGCERSALHQLPCFASLNPPKREFMHDLVPDVA